MNGSIENQKLLRSLTVLVVDDHALTRTMVRSILKGVGYENVVQAENGNVALQIVMTEKIDLVVCDWNMPGGSGIDFLRALRADVRFSSLPFLMLTAEAYRENVTAAAQAGVTDYIIKPFTSSALIEKLNKIVASIVLPDAPVRATS